MKSEKMILVVAGNYDEFKFWLSEMAVKNPSGEINRGKGTIRIKDTEYRYCATPEHMRGCHNVDVETIGSFSKRSDAAEFNEIINRAKFK